MNNKATLSLVVIAAAIGGILVLSHWWSPKTRQPSDFQETSRLQDQAATASQTSADNEEHSTSAAAVPHNTLPPGSDLLRLPGSLQVTWRAMQMPAIGLTPPYGDKYDELQANALSGDPDAAFILYQVLEECSSAFSTEIEMSRAVDQLTQTYTVQLPGRDRVVRLSEPESLDATIEYIESSFEKCTPITANQKLEREKWLKLAAENGSVLASIWLAERIENPRESLSAAESAWDAGSAQALLHMSRIHKELYMRGEDVDGNVRALAELLAYTRLLIDARGAEGDSRVEEAIASLEQEAKMFQNYQIEEAKKVAAEIIESNPRCCTRF